ncbi:MAG TPA: hypothetical protein VE402_03805 [Candidatus Angelobacter sp.]|nr:hypothetical protein [Candidatus Angelobacter sp.]
MKVFASTAALLVLVAITGCGKSNPVKPPLPQPKYAPSSTPSNVLRNLQIAYSTRDSSGYDSLFDAAYVGTSFDRISVNVLSFTKGDESRHIRALAMTHTITSISLVFPPALLRYTDSADPPGWATVPVNGMTLEINDSPTSLNLPSGETMEFKFHPIAPSPGSPTDTTWHIVRWSELP